MPTETNHTAAQVNSLSHRTQHPDLARDRAIYTRPLPVFRSSLGTMHPYCCDEVLPS